MPHEGQVVEEGPQRYVSPRRLQVVPDWAAEVAGGAETAEDGDESEANEASIHSDFEPDPELGDTRSITREQRYSEHIFRKLD